MLTGDTSLASQTSTATTQWCSLSLHPFSDPILFLIKLLWRFLWASAILQRSAIATRHCTIHSHVPNQQETAEEKLSQSSLQRKVLPLLYVSHFFFYCGFLNASENQLTGQHSKNCLKSHRFFGK